MDRLHPRYQLPLVVGVSVLVVLLVAGGVLFLPRLGSPPAPTGSLGPSATASPTGGESTPEGATRAFFDAVVAARRTNDPAFIEPFVTGRESSAYLTVAGFLAGQQQSGKASITTRLELQDISVEEAGDSARLTATLLESGYDIDLESGEPLESPVTLEPRRLTVELRRIDGAWKVDSFETGALP